LSPLIGYPAKTRNFVSWRMGVRPTPIDQSGSIRGAVTVAPRAATSVVGIRKKILGSWDVLSLRRASRFYRGLSDRNINWTQDSEAAIPVANCPARHSNIRCPFDNTESRLAGRERHVESHHRLGEPLECERANLFGGDASP